MPGRTGVEMSPELQSVSISEIGSSCQQPNRFAEKQMAEVLKPGPSGCNLRSQAIEESRQGLPDRTISREVECKGRRRRCRPSGERKSVGFVCTSVATCRKTFPDHVLLAGQVENLRPNDDEHEFD